MLLDLMELLLDVDVQGACSTCAGNPPPVGPTAAGAAGSARGSGGDPGPPDERTWRWPWDDEFRWPWDPPPGQEWHEWEHGEDWEQAKNAGDTLVDLGMEVLGELAGDPGGLGKVAGPLTTVAAGAEPLADGISALRDSGGRGLGGGSQNAEDVAEYMPEQDHPLYRDRPSSDADAGRDTSAPDEADTGQTTEERRRGYEQDAQDVLDDIETKQAMEREQRRRSFDQMWGR